MRKKVLSSLVIIGVIGVFATGSTMALFNDLEVSKDNVFTSGAVDLQVSHKQWYNGDKLSKQGFPLMDKPDTFFKLKDIKPGDKGKAKIGLNVYDNPSYLAMKMNQTMDKSVECPEPKKKALGGQCYDQGLLDENVEMEIWYVDKNGNKKTSEPVAKGTASDLFGQPMMLDYKPGSDDLEPFPAEETHHLKLEWNLPKETGNEVQKDSFKFDVWFHAEQSRHNDNPQNPL